MTERHVQAVWYDAAFRPRALVTRRGTEVRVVHPGEWNLGPGPDFRRAVLELGPERRRVTGDVEVHLCPSDWDFHGHGADPAYRNVVAHVTWGCGPEPSSLPPGCVSIWLGRFLSGETGFSPGQIDLLAYPYARLPSGRRPCEELVGGDPDVARRILAEAGRHRLRMKARRLEGRLCAASGGNGGLQVYYEEVMDALGYRRNRVPFRRVARRLPIAVLPADPEAARNAMLVAGGFETWDRRGTRPANSPERRLAGAAALFTRTGVMRTAEADDFSRPACRAAVTAICGERFVGRGRAAAILANVTLPFALATGRAAEVPDWLPPEDLSEPVRLTAFRMFGRDHSPVAFYADNGLLIQGLLQIHRDSCLVWHPDCDGCRLAHGSANMVEYEPRPRREARGDEPTPGGQKGNA